MSDIREQIFANLGTLLDHNDQSTTSKSPSGVYQIITSTDHTSNHDGPAAERATSFIAWVLDANDEPVIRGPTAPTCMAALDKLLESLSALVSLRLQRKFERFGREEAVMAFGTGEEDGGVISGIVDFAASAEPRVGTACSTDEVVAQEQVKGVSAVAELLRKDSSISWYEGDDEDEDETVVSQLESDHDRASIRTMDRAENQSDSLSWVTLEGLVPQFSDMQFVAPLRVVEVAEVNGRRNRAKGKMAEYKVGRIAEEPEMAGEEKKAAVVGTAQSERDPNMVWMKKSLCVIQV